MWAALVTRKDGRYVLVVDVEGKDAGKYGDKKAFERRSAVLIANIADVIMYHVHESAVSSYEAAGIPMLEGIFQVRLPVLHAGVFWHLSHSPGHAGLVG